MLGDQTSRAEKTLMDRQAVAHSVEKMLSDPQKAKGAMDAVRNNPAVRRYAVLVSQDREVRGNVACISSKKRKKLMKTGSPFSEGEEKSLTGTRVVLFTRSRVVKSVLLPTDCLEWKKVVFNDEYVAIFDPSETVINRKASSLVGDSVFGNVYFAKMCDNEIKQLSVEEYETITRVTKQPA